MGLIAPSKIFAAGVETPKSAADASAYGIAGLCMAQCYRAEGMRQPPQAGTQEPFPVATLSHAAKGHGSKVVLAEMGRGMFGARLIIGMVILGYAHSADAHGIAGSRFFPGTLSF